MTVLPVTVALLASLTAGFLLLVVLFRRRQKGVAKAARGTWQPTVEHKEIPRPAEDPSVAWTMPPVEAFLPGSLPLQHFQLTAGQRGTLDAFALGRVKRILDAPNLAEHAAADPESWDCVSQAVGEALRLAAARGVLLRVAGKEALNKALITCAAQGVLLAEWRQLEDGQTPVTSGAYQVRASDVFAVYRLSETMQRRVLTDLFAGVERPSPTFDVNLLVPFSIALGFTVRLRLAPPKAFAAAA